MGIKVSNGHHVLPFQEQAPQPEIISWTGTLIWNNLMNQVQPRPIDGNNWGQGYVCLSPFCRSINHVDSYIIHENYGAIYSPFKFPFLLVNGQVQTRYSVCFLSCRRSETAFYHPTFELNVSNLITINNYKVFMFDCNICYWNRNGWKFSVGQEACGEKETDKVSGLPSYWLPAILTLFRSPHMLSGWPIISSIFSFVLRLLISIVFCVIYAISHLLVSKSVNFKIIIQLKFPYVNFLAVWTS